MLQRHRAVLDEGDRLALLLHRHHDVEAGGAHLGDGGLQLGIEHLDDAAPLRAGVVPGEAEVADQVLRAAARRRRFSSQSSSANSTSSTASGVAAHEGLDGRAEHVDVAGELDHGAVDQLDRDRLELDDVLGRIHGVVEAGEMAGADGAAAEQRPQLELDAGGKAERAFGADQDMGEIVRRRVGRERIEIVAADPALHLGKARRDLVGFALADGEHVLGERAQRRACRQVAQARRRPDRNAPRVPSASTASIDSTLSRVTP